MKTIQNVLFAAVAVTLLAASSALAVVATGTGTVTLSANLPSKATLTLGGTSPSFDGTTVDQGTAIPGSVPTTVSAKVRTGFTQNATLTVQAATDFVNATYAGSDIPASDVTWTGSGNLAAGTLSKAAPVNVHGGAWNGSGTYTGNMTWSLANTSAYSTGAYGTVAINYILTAP